MSPSAMATKLAAKYKGKDKKEVVAELRQKGALGPVVRELTGYSYLYYGGTLYWIEVQEAFKKKLGITDADFD